MPPPHQEVKHEQARPVVSFVRRFEARVLDLIFFALCWRGGWGGRERWRKWRATVVACKLMGVALCCRASFLLVAVLPPRSTWGAACADCRPCCCCIMLSRRRGPTEPGGPLSRRPQGRLSDRRAVGNRSLAAQYTSRRRLTKNRDRGMRVNSHPHALHNTHWPGCPGPACTGCSARTQIAA